MKKNTLFKETKLIWLLIIPFAIILTTLLLFMIIAIGNDKNHLIIFFIVNILVFSTILALFYRFKIELFENKIILSFGIGIISKKINIKQIDKSSINQKKIPWYYGIGWRYDFKGNILFSANFGTAVTFKLMDVNKKIMIVMDKRKEFENELIKIIN